MPGELTENRVLRGDEDPAVWFREHFEDAAQQVLSFLDGPIEGKAVADVGCGDGITDLGLVLKGQPSSLVGFDLRQTDVEALRRAGSAAGVIEDLPPELSFASSEAQHVPAADDSFDVVVTWSVFEHVTQPVTMLKEIERILKPEGVLFLQLWPLFYSEHGGHLWPHYENSFPHLLHNDADIRDHLRGRRGTDPDRDAVDEYDSLNRITLEQLHNALLVAGLVVTKLELLTQPFHIPRELTHLPLSLVGIGGVKLLAVQR